MKIGMISGYDPLNPTRGGAEVSFFILAKALASLGVEVHIITSPTKDKQRRTELVDRIFVHRVLTGLNKLTFSGGGIASVMLSSEAIKKEICNIHSSENFDIIHSCNRNSAVGTILAGRKLGIPSVLHVRDYWPFCPTGSLQRFFIDPKCGSLSSHCIPCHFQDYKDSYGSTRALTWAFYAYLQTKIRGAYAKQGSRLIAISEFVKKTLVKNGFNKEQISVIPNPVEFHEKPIFQKTVDKKIVSFFGRLTVEKGVLDLIKASEIIQSKNAYNIEVRLFGQQTKEIDFKEYIKPNSCVKIMGKVPHKQVFIEYAKSDIVALPFRRPEPFGRVVPEAMSAGLPVITCNVGGVSEIIKNGKTGFLIPPGNVRMLAMSMLTLLENESLRQSIGKNAAEEVKKKYDPIAIAKTILQNYQNLVN